MTYTSICLLVVSIMLLSACGNKGDLELAPSNAQVLSQQAIDRLSTSDVDPQDDESESTPTKKPARQQQ